jgi:beta-lactam-binding protein with PASTA domain
VEVKGTGVDLKSIQKINAKDRMPNLAGMKLQDALWICEKNGLQVKSYGKGKVTDQSIAEGQIIVKGQQIQIQLN